LTYQEQKQKGKKSYAQLLEEARSLQDKLAVVYVPKLCEALRDEGKTYEEIKQQVYRDCVELGWGGKTGSTIYHNFPSWLIDDDPNHKNAVKAWESRNANKAKRLAESASLLVDVNLPPKPEPKETEINDEQLADIGVGSYGGNERTTFGQNNDVHEAARRLFKALSDIEPPVDASEDLFNDYIKPTREFRTSLAHELKKRERTDMHNLLHSVIEVSEDMIKELAKADKK